MPAVNVRQRRVGRRTPQEAGTVLTLALKHAMREARFSRSMVAASCGRSMKTVARWLNGTKPIEIHRVMSSRRLWRKFWLCVTDTDRKSGWL